MNKILIPVFSASLLLVSCSDWTDPDNKDFLPGMLQHDAATLAGLRAFKASAHPLLMMHIEGSSSAPSHQNQHPMSMPDSVDYLLISGIEDLHPTFLSELGEVRALKGTRTLNVVDYTTIRTSWEALREEAEDSGQGGDYTESSFAAYCKAETERQLSASAAYGFDGVVASYLGGFDSSAAAPFVQAIDSWAQSHPDKLLFFRGYPAYVIRLTDQTLVSRSRYILILTEDAKASVSISRQVRDQLVEGVPSDRIILEASVPSLADGGEDAQVGATVQVAADWVMDPNTASTVKCDKQGLAVSNAQEDYFNTPTYKRIRAALAILHPSISDSNTENRH